MIMLYYQMLKKTASFRYRDTSPNSFGLSSMDILLADDTQLNQYAGLKKAGSISRSRQEDQRQEILEQKCTTETMAARDIWAWR